MEEGRDLVDDDDDDNAVVQEPRSLAGGAQAAPSRTQGGYPAGVRGVEGVPVTEQGRQQEGRQTRLHRLHKHYEPELQEVQHVLHLEHQVREAAVPEEVFPVTPPPPVLLRGVPLDGKI